MNQAARDQQRQSQLYRVATTILLYSAVIAVTVNLLGIVVGSIKYPNYSQIHDTLSVLGAENSPSAGIMMPFQAVYCGLLCVFAIQLFRGAPLGLLRRIAVLIVIVAACALLLHFVFRLQDPPDVPF